MEQAIESRVILCPLYGNIKIDWKGNVVLDKHMLQFKFIESGSDKDRVRKEKSYQNCLGALLELEGFNSYVSLEFNYSEECFILWNNKFQVDIYYEETKVMNLPITGFTGNSLGMFSHFDGVDNDLVPKWNKENWKKYFYNQLYSQAFDLLKEAYDLSNKSIASNDMAGKIFKNICFK